MLYVYLGISFVLSLLYAGLMCSYVRGWKEYNPNPISNDQGGITVSVIVALRNEENHIGNLLTSLRNQDYPNELLEFIIIDDHSTDSSADLLSELVGDDLVILSASENQSGKKAALSQGIAAAKGEILLFTDADTMHEVSWVAELVAALGAQEEGMVTGPVVSTKPKDGLSTYQAMDLAGLMVISGSAVFEKIHPMAYGANMGIWKKDLP